MKHSQRGRASVRVYIRRTLRGSVPCPLLPGHAVSVTDRRVRDLSCVCPSVGRYAGGQLHDDRVGKPLLELGPTGCRGRCENYIPVHNVDWLS